MGGGGGGGGEGGGFFSQGYIYACNKIYFHLAARVPSVLMIAVSTGRSLFKNSLEQRQESTVKKQLVPLFSGIESVANSLFNSNFPVTY